MQARLGIDSDGQARVGMPGENLARLDRSSRGHEIRDVGSSQGMEVGLPRGRLVIDVGRSEVHPHHLGRPGSQGEDGSASGQAGDPRGQAFGQGRRKGLDGFATVLRVASRHGGGRGLAGRVETLGGQAGQFRGSEAGPQRERIEPGASGPVIPMTIDPRSAAWIRRAASSGDRTRRRWRRSASGLLVARWAKWFSRERPSRHSQVANPFTARM